MVVYDTITGKYVVQSGERSLYFDTLQEAASMSSKSVFIPNVQNDVTKLAQLLDEIKADSAAYNARFYGPSGANEITDAEAQVFGTTKDDVYADIVLFDKIIAALNEADNATINRTRTDL